MSKTSTRGRSDGAIAEVALRELTDGETVLVGGGILPFPILKNLPHPSGASGWGTVVSVGNKTVFVPD